MLDWLKQILGDRYTEDIDKQVSAEIGKGFVSRADFNAKNEDLKTANTTIQTLRDAAKDFDGVDVADLRKQISDWETKYNTDLAALRLDSAIDLALAGSRVRNSKAARAMLDLGGVKLGEGGKLEGLDSQIETLRRENGWLFDGTTPPGDSGGEHGHGGGTPPDGVEAAFARLNPGMKL